MISQSCFLTVILITMSKRQSKKYPSGEYIAKVNGFFPVGKKGARIKFCVFNEKDENYENVATNTIYNLEKVKSWLAKSDGLTAYVILGKNVWNGTEYNTILNAKIDVTIKLPNWVKEKQEIWQKAHSEQAKAYFDRLGKTLVYQRKEAVRKYHRERWRAEDEYFCSFIEPKMTPEMTRENYGSYWELDHITPLSDLDLTDDAVFQTALFQYKNIQPLTITDNALKWSN